MRGDLVARLHEATEPGVEHVFGDSIRDTLARLPLMRTIATIERLTQARRIHTAGLHPGPLTQRHLGARGENHQDIDGPTVQPVQSASHTMHPHQLTRWPRRTVRGGSPRLWPRPAPHPDRPRCPVLPDDR
jgi:hypothetical protein